MRERGPRSDPVLATPPLYSRRRPSLVPRGRAGSIREEAGVEEAPPSSAPGGPGRRPSRPSHASRHRETASRDGIARRKRASVLNPDAVRPGHRTHHAQGNKGGRAAGPPGAWCGQSGGLAAPLRARAAAPAEEAPAKALRLGDPMLRRKSGRRELAGLGRFRGAAGGTAGRRGTRRRRPWRQGS